MWKARWALFKSFSVCFFFIWFYMWNRIFSIKLFGIEAETPLMNFFKPFPLWIIDLKFLNLFPFSLLVYSFKIWPDFKENKITHNSLIKDAIGCLRVLLDFKYFHIFLNVRCIFSIGFFENFTNFSKALDLDTFSVNNF